MRIIQFRNRSVQLQKFLMITVLFWKSMLKPGLGLELETRKLGHCAHLYNLTSDPKEQNDLALNQPEIVSKLFENLSRYYETMIPMVQANTVSSQEADPAKFGGFVSPGWCEAKPSISEPL